MSNLQYRKSKIQERRKQTPWRDFVREICSWCPIMFYKNSETTSRYPQTSRSPNIVSTEKYNSEEHVYVSKEFSGDFNNSFKDLYENSIFSATYQFAGLENVLYSDITHDSKDVYLSILTTTGSSGVLYSISTKQNSNNIINSLGVSLNSSNVYKTTYSTNSYNIFYSKNIHNSDNIWFCVNCIGCSECIFCHGLENQSYCINNKQLSKEEFLLKKKEIIEGKNNFDTYYNKLLENKIINFNSNQSSGLGLYSCNHTTNSMFGNNIEYGNNNVLVSSNFLVSKTYDCLMGGGLDSYDLYAQIGSGLCNNIYCTIQGGTCSYIFYSMFMESCSFCLGCIGLKNKSYCILNKQYTKEERYEKVDEIFSQMDKTPSNSPLSRGGSQLGEFFPATMNPFYFNDTAAYLIDPSFTKEEVVAKGYLWRDEPIKVDIPEGAEIVKVEDLDKFEKLENGEWYIDKDILKKIVQDPEGNVYRIVPMEYDFLMKYGLPLPRKHWLDRMKENFRIS